MSDDKEAKEKRANPRKRTSNKPDDAYNPVNMAGKKPDAPESAAPDREAGIDEYNPVNMAGKGAAKPEEPE